MGQMIELTASDGFVLGAYRAEPEGTPRGGIVVIQEIFGVNTHIRSVCDRFAELGYVAVAPAIFDRTQKDFQSGYSEEEIATARGFIANPDVPAFLRDTEAAVASLKGVGKTGIVGFCLGGTVAFGAATGIDGLSAASCYYGGMIVRFADQKPRCPVQMHFGALDQGIPLSDVDTIKAKRPDCEVFVYDDAGHGFHCDERASYHEPSAAQAWERTTAFFAEHVG